MEQYNTTLVKIKRAKEKRARTSPLLRLTPPRLSMHQTPRLNVFYSMATNVLVPFSRLQYTYNVVIGTVIFIFQGILTP